MATIFAAALCSISCLSLSFGGRSQPADDSSLLTQAGSVSVAKGQETDIYYPVPYASPPNVELEDPMHHFAIVEQKADHFRVRNENGAWDVKWNARGVRAAQVMLVPQPVAPTSASANP